MKRLKKLKKLRKAVTQRGILTRAAALGALIVGSSAVFGWLSFWGPWRLERQLQADREELVSLEGFLANASRTVERITAVDLPAAQAAQPRTELGALQFREWIWNVTASRCGLHIDDLDVESEARSLAPTEGEPDPPPPSLAPPGANMLPQERAMLAPDPTAPMPHELAAEGAEGGPIEDAEPASVAAGELWSTSASLRGSGEQEDVIAWLALLATEHPAIAIRELQFTPIEEEDPRPERFPQTGSATPTGGPSLPTPEFAAVAPLRFSAELEWLFVRRSPSMEDTR